MKPKTYAEFWPIYLKAHSKPHTRAFHYVGSLVGLVFLFLAFQTGNLLFIVGGIIAGYSVVWFSHFFIEHNKPATFGHPFWSFFSDFRMLFLAITGKLDSHLKLIDSRDE